ncbi:hypothetical protein RIF29_10503 [Crotalaria pallida]|uniref:Uncharacterized protein n=1 Tax=Crotalaria pallida TaxID=3830 RepID=A0AAN9FSY0_CROPI
MIGKESVRGIIPSSFSACGGLSVRLGSKKRLSRAKTCKKETHLTCKNVRMLTRFHCAKKKTREKRIDPPRHHRTEAPGHAGKLGCGFAAGSHGRTFSDQSFTSRGAGSPFTASRFTADPGVSVAGSRLRAPPSLSLSFCESVSL